MPVMPLRHKISALWGKSFVAPEDDDEDDDDDEVDVDCWWSVFGNKKWVKVLESGQQM